MTHFSPRSSHYRREWVKDLPARYLDDWERLQLVKPPITKSGDVIRSVPFYAAQQLHKLNKVPRQLRGATKPVVVTTSKIGEPYYTPQLDFNLRTTNDLPLTYNNLLDPHLKSFFNHPSKRRMLQKRGFVTKQGDVICHSYKELREYREFLYSNYQELIKTLRSDIDKYLPKILAKRRAIIEVTSEQRRYSLLRKLSNKDQGIKRKARKTKSLRKKVSSGKADDLTSQSSQSERTYSEEEVNAANKIKAVYKGYSIRSKLAKAYAKNLKLEMKKRFGSSKQKIWNKTTNDIVMSCHTHSCTESLARQFVITDLPAMLKFLKDPVAQQSYRKNYLLRLLHTPCMNITGTMVKPLLQDEIKHHGSKFRWV